MAAKLGLEPRLTESESAVLPLHHFAKQTWRRKRDLNPRAGVNQPTPLAGEPLRPLGYFSKAKSKTWRRRRDSNPRFREETLVFKTSAFDRSATPPTQLANTT